MLFRKTKKKKGCRERPDVIELAAEANCNPACLWPHLSLLFSGTRHANTYATAPAFAFIGAAPPAHLSGGLGPKIDRFRRHLVPFSLPVRRPLSETRGNFANALAFPRASLVNDRQRVLEWLPTLVDCWTRHSRRKPDRPFCISWHRERNENRKTRPLSPIHSAVQSWTASGDRIPDT